jgi:hypothetical protein
MTIQFLSVNGNLLRQFYSRDGAVVHVPRLNEYVVLDNVTLQVSKVTSVVQSEFTTQPIVQVELAPPSKLRSILR